MAGRAQNHASPLRGGAGRRRKKRRVDEAYYIARRKLFQQLCAIWIFGFILIDAHFFYHSLTILDEVMEDSEHRRRKMMNSMIKPLAPEDYLTEEQQNRPPRPEGPPPRKENFLPRLVADDCDSMVQSSQLSTSWISKKGYHSGGS